MLSPLALALPAMTALQATVALGLFALSVLAPQLGLSVPQLAALNTLLFGVGTVSALQAGRWLQRWGDWPVAAACAAAVALGMVGLLVGGPLAPWVAVLCFGLAFGPETPASAAVLSRLTPPARRPWVFSVRQTGNQIGAMLGSVTLPALLVLHPRGPYLVVALLAAAMAGWCLWLARDARLAPAAVSTGPAPGRLAATAPPASRTLSAALPAPRRAPRASLGTPGAGPTRQALQAVRGSRALQALAAATLCYTAVQMCLNTFLMSLAVREWQLEVGQAARWVAGLQAAGLAGRLFWGWRAQRSASAARLLGLLGLLMALSGGLLMTGPGAWPGALWGALIALLGCSASGWNGVLVAEVARIAGPARAGALAGAILAFGYAGLTAAPLAFAALSSAGSMAGAFAVLFAAAGVAGIALLRTPVAPGAPLP